jgi:hypothetical protein
MDIINHGDWERYNPPVLPVDAPPNALFARRIADGADWYDYVNSGRAFAKDSIKMTVTNSRVSAAVIDATMLFPGGSTLLEVKDVAVDDPQKHFGRKVYDPLGRTFRDPPPIDYGPAIPELVRRIAELEKKKGP